MSSVSATNMRQWQFWEEEEEKNKDSSNNLSSQGKGRGSLGYKVVTLASYDIIFKDKIVFSFMQWNATYVRLPPHGIREQTQSRSKIAHNFRIL